MVRRYSDLRVTGEPDVGWLQWVADQYPAQFGGRLLSLCCGFGGMERELVQRGAAHVAGVDIAETAIGQAIELAGGAGFSDRINYGVADLNTYCLEPGSYDLVMAASAFHHVFRPRAPPRSDPARLGPDGVLVAADYVGPSRFQVDRSTTSLINDVLAVLPERFRTSLSDATLGELKDEWAPPTVDWFLQYDPSEAVRSSEVLAAVHRFFHVEIQRSSGGGLLHWLLAGISGELRPRPGVRSCRLGLLHPRGAARARRRPRR